MRARLLEVRWHDSRPIQSCDFQPIPFKKARPTNERDYATQSYRLATAGEDNNVRVWMVHPNMLPPVTVAETRARTQPVPHPPRLEYLSTLSRHSASVNVVRFSPNGELIASAGDDGMIIIWAQSTHPPPATFGEDDDDDKAQPDKEHWKPRISFRCTTMQVYDLAWSPTGEYIIAGSTDNTARIFLASDGKCVHEMADHSHYVQGVSWDPLNEFVATQSSDRSVHIYTVSPKPNSFEVHAVGKNTKLHVRHSRTPSSSSRRPKMSRRESAAFSDSESAMSDAKDEGVPGMPPTPSASVIGTPSLAPLPMLPPVDKVSSRRSSFSGSNAPTSPSLRSHYARSPSPMPALPAIRAPPSVSAVRLYGDESHSNFFRRLTFSPDGAMLMTPAGQFEDPSVDETTRGRRQKSITPAEGSSSTVYVYNRANFARPPVSQLPGLKKSSIAVKFSPILYELRPGLDIHNYIEPKKAVIEKGKEISLPIDLVGAASRPNPDADTASVVTASNSTTLPSPSPSAAESSMPPATPTSAPANASTGAVFQLPYRMLFAVATNDTITIYDTQQAAPACILTKLHYDEFTDMSWSPDGQCLIMASRDGYCTLAVFDEPILAHSTQQQALQLQSIAASHSMSAPLPSPAPSQLSLNAGPSSAGANQQTPTPSMKRPEPIPLTPSNSMEEAGAAPSEAEAEELQQPVKKKRRIALTHLGDA